MAQILFQQVQQFKAREFLKREKSHTFGKAAQQLQYSILFQIQILFSTVILYPPLKFRHIILIGSIVLLYAFFVKGISLCLDMTEMTAQDIQGLVNSQDRTQFRFQILCVFFDQFLSTSDHFPGTSSFNDSTEAVVTTSLSE